MKTKFFLLLFFIATISLVAQEKRKVIIDADTGNEVDDLYAVVRGVIEPGWEVLALNATQWQVSHWAVEKSMEESYRLNKVLLAYLDPVGRIKSNRGAEARLFDWGELSQPSTASNFIISEARKMKEGKLTVIALGALTNVASALLDAPDIAGKIELYWLGTSYDFEKKAMKTIDFNCVMDIQAVEVVLNSQVELHIMPVSAAYKLTFDWDETVKVLKGKNDMYDFLLHRWFNHLDDGRDKRTIWDLALIQAIIFPEFANEVKIKTSVEHGNRELWMYKNIEADKMQQEFYSVLSSYAKE